MNETVYRSASLAASARTARVLVFCVDDASFGMHVDWVDAVYPHPAVCVHAFRTRTGQTQRFLAYGAEPALVIDLREILDLPGGPGVPHRAHYLVVRSGSLRLAIPVDACLGMRGLDLQAQPPVPSALLRDGGFPVAHIVNLDGKMLAVLDPSHLLGDATRLALDALRRRAERYLVRQAKLDALWAEIRTQPSATSLRMFAGLCARNGRARAAAAARLVLAHLTGTAAAHEPPSELDRFVGTLLQLTLERRSGELVMAAPTGVNGHRVVFADGRIVDATSGVLHGKAAFRQLVATRPSQHHFIDAVPGSRVGPIQDSTAALAISALEALGRERRPRRR